MKLPHPPQQPSPSLEAVVLGASGYVGGELLRLLAGHPVFQLKAAVARSHGGEPLASLFPQLGGVYGTRCFVSPEDLPACLAGSGPLALFSALPHGRSAGALKDLLSLLKNLGREARVVDCAADFRLSPRAFVKLYSQPHGAPGLCAAFACGLPDLVQGVPAPLIAHPGCFTTSVVLPAWPLLAAGLLEPHLRAACVTGSSGSGRQPGPTTHHPERHGNLHAYLPLAHRHQAEMEALLPRGKSPCAVAFVPHAGPFVRGIHATLFLKLSKKLSAEEVAAKLRAFFEDSPFVQVSTQAPRLKDVVGTNRAHIGVAVSKDELVLLCVIDNLMKGAAGGAVQWMNRLFGLEESAGLLQPGLLWS